jgi:predicted nuclease of predicted toxin-antitoxin system
MRILFDQGTPVPLRRALTSHHVETAYERGWARLKNGDLLDCAESNGFDVLVTTDSNMKYQQQLAGRRIAIVVLTTTDWRRIQINLDEVVQAIDAASSPSYVEVTIP